MTISVISLRRLTAHWGGSWWRGQIMGSRWSATNRRLAEEAEDCGRRPDILVDRELAGHRGAAVAEPAFIAGPGVDAGIERRVRPGCVPRPHALVLFFAPRAVWNQARVVAAFAVIPGVHVKDLSGAPRSESGHPGLVERITAEEVIACGVERGEIAPRTLRFGRACQGAGHGTGQDQRRGLLSPQHRHVNITTPTKRAFGRGREHGLVGCVKCRRSQAF